MFKWTGGKRRELPLLEPFFPEFVANGSQWRFVEPFVGAGAAFFRLAHPDSVINDLDTEVINFYTQVAAANQEMVEVVSRVEQLFATGTRDQQAAEYYRLRNLDRDGGLERCSPGLRAARFFVVNQLAFSGMRRFNAQGEFNVPFGHYRSFRADVLRDQRYVDLLRSATIRCGDWRTALADCDQPNTFIFVDPPYTRVMRSYSAGARFTDDDHRQLAEFLRSLCHAAFLLVVDASELTTGLYRGMIRHRYPVSYGVNIKNRFDQAAEHLVVCNL